MADRFLRKLKLSASGCIEWTGSVWLSGYGRFRIGGKVVRAHRHAWTLKHGAVPDGMCVLHSCDNRRCCNVDHLFIGTQHENIADRHAKGRDGTARGELCGTSKLSLDDVVRIREACLFGAKQADLVSIYGMSQPGISAVVTRRNWGHAG